MSHHGNIKKFEPVLLIQGETLIQGVAGEDFYLGVGKSNFEVLIAQGEEIRGLKAIQSLEVNVNLWEVYLLDSDEAREEIEAHKQSLTSATTEDNFRISTHPIHQDYSELMEGFEIFSRYPGSQTLTPLGELIGAGVDPDLVSKEDTKRLEEIGWNDYGNGMFEKFI